LNGRQSATSTRVGREDGLGGALGGRAVEDARAAEPKRVAVAKPAAAADPLAVDERAVPGEAVVHEGALEPDHLELRMEARDLGVPGQVEVGGRAAAHPERVGLLADDEDPLLVLRVAVDEERTALPLGLDLRLEFGRGAGSRTEPLLVHGPEHSPTPSVRLPRLFTG
jgi:hypothetical protein